MDPSKTEQAESLESPARGSDAPSASGKGLTRWLREWLRSLGGNVIIANISEGASNVVVGIGNIQIGRIQIGTFKVPTLPVVATLLFVVAVGTTFLWLTQVPATMPVSRLNVAVADIGLADPDGQLSTSDDGRNLSEWIFRELETGLEDIPTGQPIVWHDSMGPLGKRTKIGMIDGVGADDRTNSAAALAERLNANVVIYGVLSASGNNATFAPEFYVGDVLDQASELVGPHQLGEPIEVRLPIDPYDLRTGEYLRSELGTRIEALAWLTYAIVLDRNGDHESAFEVLGEAESELIDWRPDQGKEILHYFQGREALYLGREDPSWLEEAEQAYLRALVVNPDYARAHIGLGGVYYSLAQGQTPEARLNSDAIDLAISHYELAIEGEEASPGSHIELKGRLGLGLALRLLGDAYINSASFESAASVLDGAIDHMEQALEGIPPDDHRLMSEAFLALGATYQLRGHATLAGGDPPSSIGFYERAESAYSNCIAHAEQDFYDSSSRDQMTESCEPYRIDVLEVLESAGVQG